MTMTHNFSRSLEITVVSVYDVAIFFEMAARAAGEGGVESDVVTEHAC